MKTLKQVAEKLGITDSALRHRIRDKTMKATKIGRDWFVSTKEFNRLLKEKVKTEEEV